MKINYTQTMWGSFSKKRRRLVRINTIGAVILLPSKALAMADIKEEGEPGIEIPVKVTVTYTIEK